MSINLNALDDMGSLLCMSAGGTTQGFSYTPFGSTPARGGDHSLLPGFNGERLDPVSQTYHLGNGYRTYNPVLMRFNAPDSWSPFGGGGLNPYAYCEGDPINRADPSGHMSWQAGVGIGLGILGILGAVFTFGQSLAAAAAAEAAMTASMAADLIATGLGVAACVTSIASDATEESDPEASQILGWVSFGLGIAGAVTGVANAGKTIHSKFKKKIGTIDLWRGCGGLDSPGHDDSDTDVHVDMSQYKQVGSAQGIKTSGMGDCTSIAIFSETEKSLIHILGSNLDTPMVDRLGLTAGDVVSEMIKDREFEPNEHIAVVYGVNNGDWGKRVFIGQKFKGSKPILDLLSKFPQENISFFQSVDFEITKAGKVRNDLLANNLLSENQRQALLSKLDKYAKKRGMLR